MLSFSKVPLECSSRTWLCWQWPFEVSLAVAVHSASLKHVGRSVLLILLKSTRQLASQVWSKTARSLFKRVAGRDSFSSYPPASYTGICFQVFLKSRVSHSLGPNDGACIYYGQLIQTVWRVVDSWRVKLFSSLFLCSCTGEGKKRGWGGWMGNVVGKKENIKPVLLLG